MRFCIFWLLPVVEDALGWGGGGTGGNRRTLLTQQQLSNRVLSAFPRAMFELSVHAELQGTIDFVTPPKKRSLSPADSTASVAGSVWDAEPAKVAVLALQHGAQDRAHVLVLGCGSVTGLESIGLYFPLKGLAFRTPAAGPAADVGFATPVRTHFSVRDASSYFSCAWQPGEVLPRCDRRSFTPHNCNHDRRS